MGTFSLFVGATVLTSTVAPADARLMRAWGYADLTANADLIVIATTVKTTTSKTLEVLPGISSDNAPVEALRVATELRVVATLKGKAGVTVVLHHDALAYAGVMVNGPGLVTFDPQAHKQFLMFLRRDKDGEYSPVSGQTDPNQSVEELQQLAPSP